MAPSGGSSLSKASPRCTWGPHQFGLEASWLLSVGCYHTYDTFTHNYSDLLQVLGLVKLYRGRKCVKMWVFLKYEQLEGDRVCVRAPVSQLSVVLAQPLRDRVGMKDGLALKLMTWRQNTWVLLQLTQIYFVTLYKSLNLFLPGVPACKRRIVFPSRRRAGHLIH